MHLCLLRALVECYSARQLELEPLLWRVLCLDHLYQLYRGCDRFLSGWLTGLAVGERDLDQ